MFEDLVFSFIVLAVSAVALAAVTRRHPRAEAQLLLLGFLAHIAAVFAQDWITREIYGGGDVDAYYASGVEVANALRVDFANIAPELLKVFFHWEDVLLPIEVFGGPSATGSQTVVVSFLCLLFKDSRLAASTAVAMWAFFGKVAIFFALREGLALTLRRRVLLATVVTPSVVFWSGTMAKEAVVIGALGFLTLVLRGLVSGDLRLTRVLLALSFSLPVAMIKPYVLVPFSVAAGVWFYWERTRRRGQSVVVKTLYLAIGVTVAITGVVVIGWLYPRFAVDNLSKSAANMQEVGSTVEGGSTYQLTEAVAEDTSLARQLAVAPLALPTALFRPFLVEVRNPMMALNSIETTILLVLFLRLLWRVGLPRLRRIIFEDPTLMFCFTFTILLGTAVGLASTNLGTLSRYRMPFMPFYVALLLVLDYLARPKPVNAPESPALSLPALR